MACLFALSNHAERHYRTIQIPKRSGGIRELQAPDPLLKFVQRNILHHVLNGFSPACSATAYHKGRGAVVNARVHVNKAMVMKLDVKDFFSSITFPMVLSHAFPSSVFPPSVGVMLSSLCCCRDRLPQGAPTSPAVSNLVMRPFDLYMEQWCRDQGIDYSRYCDDMTFSGEFDAAEVKAKVNGFLNAMGFSLNRKKTRVLKHSSRMTVTGIVVNVKAQVSRDYRRRLRQEIYYCEKYGIGEHLKKMGYEPYLSEFPNGERKYLNGLLGRCSYVLLVNPDDLWFQEARERIKQMLGRDKRL